jgi:hypothetical protein
MRASRPLDNEAGAKRPGAHGLYKSSDLCGGWPADLERSGGGGARVADADEATTDGAPRDAPAGIVQLGSRWGPALLQSRGTLPRSRGPPVPGRFRAGSPHTTRPHAAAPERNGRPRRRRTGARRRGAPRGWAAVRLPAPATCYGLRLRLGGQTHWPRTGRAGPGRSSARRICTSSHLPRPVGRRRSVVGQCHPPTPKPTGPIFKRVPRPVAS